MSTNVQHREGTESKTKPHLLNLTLAGLPELEHFETDEQRQAALEQIGQEAADVKSGGFWLAIGVLVGGVVGGQYLIRGLMGMVSWPRWLEDSLILLGTGVLFVFILRFLHRRGAAAELRQKLLQEGVPVCVACGYLLRGLPLDPGRCPECGRDFEPRVRAILIEQGASNPDPQRSGSSAPQDAAEPPAA